MKAIKLFIILLFSSSIYGQFSDDCLINPTIKSKLGCSVRLKQLKQSELEKYREYCSSSKSYNLTEYQSIKNSDSLESYLIKVYPLNFSKIKSGVEFKNNIGETIKIQKSKSNLDFKQNKDYNFSSKTDNYIVISQTGYESWSYLLINLNSFISYHLPGNPVFINQHLFYGYTNYYGEGELTIIDIKNGNDILLSFRKEIISVSYSGNLSMGILLEFRKDKCKAEQVLNIVVK